MDLKTIGTLTEDFAGARTKLAERITSLSDELAAVKKRHIGLIRKAVQVAKEKQALLAAALEEAPELFVKPRTVIISGIKVGYQKGKGEIEWEDDDQVVRLIRKHFPEQEDVLIKTTEKPLKKALSQLTVAELKKLGITVEDTGDHILVKPTDSDVDKYVNMLLKETKEIVEEAA